MILLLVLACSEAPPPRIPEPDAADLPRRAPPPAPESSAPLRIELAPELGDYRVAETNCGKAGRMRGTFEERVATVPDVSDDHDCRLSLKGGVPYSFEPVRGGQDLYCTVHAAELTCAPREPTPEEILPSRKPPPGTGDVTVFYDTPEELQRVHVKCDDGFDDWPVPRQNRVIVRGLALGVTCELTPLTKYTRHTVRPGDDLVCKIVSDVQRVEDLSISCEPRPL